MKSISGTQPPLQLRKFQTAPNKKPSCQVHTAEIYQQIKCILYTYENVKNFNKGNNLCTVPRQYLTIKLRNFDSKLYVNQGVRIAYDRSFLTISIFEENMLKENFLV